MATPPAGEDDLFALEKHFGVKLPDDFKESYRINNTFRGNSPFGQFRNFFSIHDMLELSKLYRNDWNVSKEDECDDDDDNCPFVIDTKEIVQPSVMWPREWITFGDLYDFQYMILDLREEMEEYQGSVILFDTDDGELTFGYPSFEACLADETKRLLETGYI